LVRAERTAIHLARHRPRTRKLHQGPLILLCLSLGIPLAVTAQAQQAAPSPSSLTEQDLAKSVHNPFEDFVKVPIQAATGFNIGPYHKAGETLNVQPEVPFSLNAQWDLIARLSLSATYLPSPSAQVGLNDLQTSFFLTPSKEDVWVWGVGPIFQFPTASSSDLGTGRWSAGPTGALIYSKGPWFNGILAYQLMSFAGDRDRGSVNQTYIEPDISYNSESGFYAQIDPPITYDWTAEKSNAWELPVGADIGDVFTIGAQQMGLQIGSYDLLKHTEGGPDWIIRVQLTLLFPTGR
jgi:hypothetical protein